MALLAAVSRLVRRSNSFVEDAAFLDIPAHLAKTLMDLANNQSEPPRLTQAALAAIVGATRESINKWLGFYKRQGWIEINHGNVTVLAPEELQKRIR